ncbi:acyltransferase [Stenomitos frigidus]|nr:acyltransferase [Stenomitos frigidus]
MQMTHAGSSETWSRVKELLVSTLVGSLPSKPGKLLRRLLYRPILKTIGKGVNIDHDCKFLGAQRIHLGDETFISHNVSFATLPNNQIVLRPNVSLGDNVSLNSDGHDSKILLHEGVKLDRGVDLRAHGGCIEIGQNTYIGPYGCLAGPGCIRIGRDCMIASHTGIYANNHNFDDLTRPINVQGTTNQGIVIEDDCWLGTGVKVLDGVTIGKGCVIGAGAVVTKDMPPFSVAVGVPAKVISRRQHSKQDRVKVCRAEVVCSSSV